ncbi:MAG: restriction endonuclease subunit S [Veillonella sp.]|nr:restriction endonuclease subunit S [Veillonella sp.]
MDYVKLGDLCVINSGGTPRRNNESYWKNGDIPWVKISDLNNGVVESTEEFITLDGLKNSSAKIFPQGTLLYTIFATIGEVAILNIDAATNQAIVGLQLKENQKVYLKYIYYYLKSQTNIIKHLGRGVAQNNINLSVVKNMIIPIVSLEKQSNIIATLSKLEKIKKNRIIISNYLDGLIKSRFVEMFGDPVINNKNWFSMNLGEISIKISSGNTPQGGSRVYTNHGILFIRSQNVWNNRLDLADVVYISESLNEKMKETRLRRNDLLITKTGRFNTENSSLGRCALYTGSDFQANINGHVYLVRLKVGYNPNFILSILTSEAYKNLIRTVCVGGIDKRQLNKFHIESFPIIIPPVELQNQYVQFLLKINKLKSDVQKSIDETQLLMNSLMQEYFG